MDAFDELIEDDEEAELQVAPPVGLSDTGRSGSAGRDPSPPRATPVAMRGGSGAAVPPARAPQDSWAFQPVAKGKAAAARPQNASEKAAAAAAAAARPDMTVEKFSGLRIKGRVLSSVVVEERLRDLRVLRLPHIRGEVEGSWAVVAALAEKSATKEASNGKKFGVWTLTDLDGCSVRLFLFGEAFAEHWKEIETSLVAVVSAKVKRDDDGGGAGGGSARSGVSLSIDKAAQLYKLGTAADFARCKADRKDGKPCSMAVNKSISEYCCFHAAAAIKALQTGRMELGGGGLVPFSMRRAAAVSGRGAGRSSGMWGPMSMPGMQKPLPSAPSRNATPQEMARLASGGYGRIQSQGSRYLLNVSAPPAQPAAPKGPPGRGEQAVRGTVAPPPPLGAQARMRLLGSSAPLPPPRAVPPPAPAAIMMVETDLFGDDDAEALAFARSVSQRVGGFEVPNPGGPRPLPKPLSAPPPAAGPAAAPASAMPRPPLSAHVPPQRPAAAAPKPPARPQGGGGGKRSFAETFAGVTAGQDADRGSRHQDLALEEEERRTFAALDVLAKREGLHDAASKLTKMSVKAFKCSCGSLTESRRPDCAARGHGGGVTTVVKRFFVCRSCHRRAFALDSAYPARACGGCGGTDFDRAPMSSAKGPRLNVHDGVACREGLLPRGEEHAFSLKSLR